MQDHITAALKGILEKHFDMVASLYDQVNMAEHRNHLCCFIGIDGYKLFKARYNGTGAAGTELSDREVEIRYLIKAVSPKDMSAAELCKLMDDKVIGQVEKALSVKEIKRCSCIYSKELERYTISAELTVVTGCPGGLQADAVAFSIGALSFACMDSFEIIRETKISEFSTADIGVCTRIVGRRPVRIHLHGLVSGPAASTVYASLTDLWGGVLSQGVSVGGILFTNLTMSALRLKTEAEGVSELTVEFTEVNAN